MRPKATKLAALLRDVATTIDLSNECEELLMQLKFHHEARIKDPGSTVSTRYHRELVEKIDRVLEFEHNRLTRKES